MELDVICLLRKKIVENVLTVLLAFVRIAVTASVFDVKFGELHRISNKLVKTVFFSIFN
jgi:hypothetical protein